MAVAVHVVSSMATRFVLAEPATTFESRSGQTVRVEAVGGVDAARRVRAGEPFDVVVLASTAIDALLGEGRLTGRRVDLMTSPIAVGARSGTVHPEIGSAEAVKQAVLAAGRVTIPPPGVPVSALSAGERSTWHSSNSASSPAMASTSSGSCRRNFSP